MDHRRQLDSTLSSSSTSTPRRLHQRSSRVDKAKPLLLQPPSTCCQFLSAWPPTRHTKTIDLTLSRHEQSPASTARPLHHHPHTSPLLPLARLRRLACPQPRPASSRAQKYLPGSHERPAILGSPVIPACFPRPPACTISQCAASDNALYVSPKTLLISTIPAANSRTIHITSIPLQFLSSLLKHYHRSTNVCPRPTKTPSQRKRIQTRAPHLPLPAPLPNPPSLPLPHRKQPSSTPGISHSRQKTAMASTATTTPTPLAL